MLRRRCGRLLVHPLRPSTSDYPTIRAAGSDYQCVRPSTDDRPTKLTEMPPLTTSDDALTSFAEMVRPRLPKRTNDGDSTYAAAPLHVHADFRQSERFGTRIARSARACTASTPVTITRSCTGTRTRRFRTRRRAKSNRLSRRRDNGRGATRRSPAGPRTSACS